MVSHEQQHLGNCLCLRLERSHAPGYGLQAKYHEESHTRKTRLRNTKSLMTGVVVSKQTHNYIPEPDVFIRSAPRKWRMTRP